jgi:hypothetical protein
MWNTPETPNSLKQSVLQQTTITKPSHCGFGTVGRPKKDTYEFRTHQLCRAVRESPTVYFATSAILIGILLPTILGYDNRPPEKQDLEYCCNVGTVRLSNTLTPTTFWLGLQIPSTVRLEILEEIRQNYEKLLAN